MAGHSKWKTTKIRKGKADAARSKLFGRLSREITIAARIGGGDPDANPRLRLAIERARGSSMPVDNINRAVDKGTGEGADAVDYEEITYEGYGPGGVAVLVEVATDNRNRTVADIRHHFSKHGGNLGENGSVAWQFERQGNITIPRQDTDGDELLEVALEAGASDLVPNDENFEITTPPEQFHDVQQALEKEGFKISNAELAMTPQHTVAVDNDTAQRLFKLLDALEDHDDVQNVWSNFETEDEAFAVHE